MEAANGHGSPNSKVIVQFSDPSNLFGDVAPLLANRLPLGNLHWKSPTRPLRSIEELDISLDREQPASGDGANTTRRHQIPGLRQTPFVKVLLLRCDDKDKYKESVRKDAKDWVKSLGFSSSGKPTSKGQERHDAFEYLILHVVVPGTAAATQPKSSKHISLEATESTDSVNSKSKWTGKSSSTVLDKIRADFASSSKAPFERVAQVRLNDSSKPSTALSPLELEEQWQDLVDKLKTAILQSFDARVAQYEEDIRERDAQRNLPGWNFCTFFILKEGLAKGFENVGLLEDALQIYEELDAGLDLLIQEQSKATSIDSANALLPYSSDLKDIIRIVLDGQSSTNGAASNPVALTLQGWSNAEAKRFPWKLERRDYQQMILTNQVSALDFRIYIFIRQMQLMLRRASISVPLPKSKLTRQGGPRWDADSLSEVCEKSIKFMNLAARNLRQDLFAAWGGQDGLPEEERKVQKVAIDNIVASWKWASLLQSLSECQIVASFTNLASRKGDTSAGQLFNPADIANNNVHGSDASISTVSSSDSASTNGSDRAVAHLFSNLRIVRGSKPDLIFWSAELFTLMRTIFTQLCRQSKILPDVFRGSRVGGYVIEDASLASVGVMSPSLKAMVHDEETAFAAYKLLTVCACQCYTTAGKARAAKQLLFDLATLEMHNTNYDAALGWLDAIPGFLDEPPSTSIEQSMLRLYIECLRRADRPSDLVHSLMLEIQTLPDVSRRNGNVQELWNELIGVASRVDVIEFPFDTIFVSAEINEYINVNDAFDGVSINITLHSVLSIPSYGSLEAELILRSQSANSPSELKLACHMDNLTPGNLPIVVACDTSIDGWFDITCLNLKFGNVLFKLDLQPAAPSDDDDRQLVSTPQERKLVYLYPRYGSPALSILHAPVVDLAEKKKLQIIVSSGSSDVSAVQVRLKPGTAGLRLDLVSASCAGDATLTVERVDDGHVLSFASLTANTQTTVDIPYSFDDVPAATASIKANLRYLTRSGRTNELSETLSFMTLLPIGVNVQDIFLSGATFSRFTLAPSRLVPLLITDCHLEAGDSTEVSSAGSWSQPVTAFPKQPASWVVEIILGTNEKQKQLGLSVKYRCMDEAIISSICDSFRHAVQASEYNFAARPLEGHLRNKIQSLWTEQEIELAVLVSEIALWSFEEFDWTTLISAFKKQVDSGLEQWLRSWHEQNAAIPLKPDAAPERTLRLLVDAPVTDVLVSTEIRLPTKASRVIGQPILATLCTNATIHAETSIEIAIEVSNQSDLWLVGGQRRINLSKSETAASSTIVLIAQKTGSLVLPTIDVKCRNTSPGASPGEVASFEIENLSIADTVTVTSQIQSTTLAIAEGDGADGHWLIDSRTATPS